MVAKDSDEPASTFSWWQAKRMRYNVGLVISGFAAFICYVLADMLVNTVGEITIFTMFMQALGYLSMMFVANICYFAGPIAEKVIRPTNVERFRKIAYGLGFWFSVALPFSVPVLTLFSVEIVTFFRKVGVI
jgi:hypothetical protein